MDQQAQIARPQRRGLRIGDLLDGLHLAEMVAPADAAQSFGTDQAVEACGGQGAGRVFGIGAIVQHRQPAQGLLDLQPVTGKIEAPERHAAADVRPHELRPDPVREEGRADRAEPARVQIGETGDGHHAGPGGHLCKLVLRAAVDPGLR